MNRNTPLLEDKTLRMIILMFVLFRGLMRVSCLFLKLLILGLSRLPNGGLKVTEGFYCPHKIAGRQSSR
jgi:hypothetical protein